jgi:hypothetical protein
VSNLGWIMRAVQFTGAGVARAQDVYQRKGDTSFELEWDSQITGSWAFWGSNETIPSQTDESSWVQIALAQPPVNPANVAGQDTVDLTGVPFRWVRVVLTITSVVAGGGSASVFAWQKGGGD